MKVTKSLVPCVVIPTTPDFPYLLRKMATEDLLNNPIKKSWGNPQRRHHHSHHSSALFLLLPLSLAYSSHFNPFPRSFLLLLHLPPIAAAQMEAINCLALAMVGWVGLENDVAGSSASERRRRKRKPPGRGK
jgi:hypothetical protein